MPISGNNSTSTAKRVDPFPTFKFHVTLGDLTEAAFMECAGLSMSTEVFTYIEAVRREV